MSERIRRWCTIHHFFHRDCADCLDKDYADLERQLAEAQEKLEIVARWAGGEGSKAELRRSFKEE